MTRVLFILKRRCTSYGYAGGLSTGLLNSALFVRNMLQDNGIDAEIVVVTDNNDIDREVTKYRPTHVIIEALWVVPEKFLVLQKLHPKVRWIVRLHSEIPFLANEGMAMDWITRYISDTKVTVAVNSLRAKDDLAAIISWVDRSRIIYLPNYYPTSGMIFCGPRNRSGIVNVGCFGAIRPLKNQLLQAVAAIKFANETDVRLRFHINVGRIEMKGSPVLHNLESLFPEGGMHELVKHDWLDHDEFKILLSTMDLCMQVSFSETFNIVAADSITNGVPIVVSREVPWAKTGLADPTDMDDMVDSLKTAWEFRRTNVFVNQLGLSSFAKKSQKAWTKKSLWVDQDRK